MNKNKYSGFHIIEIIIVVAILAVGGFVAWKVFFGDQKADNTQKQTSSASQSSNVKWEWTGNEWKAMGTAPACASPPVLTTPTDLSRVTSILYPGQARGGNYKPHGGFRLNGDNKVVVKAPMDATLVSASRYIEQGEVQYLLFFVNSCGIAYRFDHLLSLQSSLQAMGNSLPSAQENNSQTTKLSQLITVKKGDTIATEVGFKKTGNVSFDWGVYDLRQPNEASKKAAFAKLHAKEKEQAFYGVCWFDWLSTADEAKVRNLPAADMASGKTGDYCVDLPAAGY